MTRDKKVKLLRRTNGDDFNKMTSGTHSEDLKLFPVSSETIKNV